MEFGCSVCEYTSNRKSCVQQHINKKQSCGIGTKEIIEIPVDIKCEFCNKKFAILMSLKRHQKNNCKLKDKVKDDEIKKLKQENEILKSKNRQITNIEKYNSMYILQEREFLNNKQPVYKLGITETIHNRMGQYPKGSRIICVIPVDGDPEALCLVKFRSLFIARTDIGAEYFEGCQNTMVKTLIECCT
jgi:hypothetical protein